MKPLTLEEIYQITWYIERTSDYYGRKDYFYNREMRILKWLEEQRKLREDKNDS